MTMNLEDLVEVTRKRYRSTLETDNKELQEKQRKLLQTLTYQLLCERADKINREYYSSFSLGFTTK